MHPDPPRQGPVPRFRSVEKEAGQGEEAISSKSLSGLDEVAGVVRQGSLPASDEQILLDGVVWRATK
jgi:hypothetical protein